MPATRFPESCLKDNLSMHGEDGSIRALGIMEHAEQQKSCYQCLVSGMDGHGSGRVRFGHYLTRPTVGQANFDLT